jgi:putative transposase
LKNNAKYINLEDLNSDGFNDRILRNWSYYQLQQFIEYKAKMNNIIVRYVNPYHTSQNCSHCGHWEEGQRISQSEFLCKSCGYKANADFNASRNIAKSIEFKKTK